MRLEDFYQSDLKVKDFKPIYQMNSHFLKFADHVTVNIMQLVPYLSFQLTTAVSLEILFSKEQLIIII